LLKRDGKIFETWPTLEPEAPQAWEGLFDYQLAIGKFDDAEKTLAKLSDKAVSGGDYTTAAKFAARYIIAKQQIENLGKTVDGILSGMVQADPNRRGEISQQIQTSEMMRARQYGLVLNQMKKPGYEKDQDVLYDIADVYRRAGHPDSAIANLETARKAGFASYQMLMKIDAWKPYENMPAWKKLLADMKTDWDAGTGKRKTEALDGRVDKDAPLWSLPNVKGDSIRLADLKGNIVILDFWATWCGPCRMAMPVLDKFVKENTNPKVKVFSVNVWERGKTPVEVAKFMTDRQYAMTLLYGYNGISKDYQFDGIPYLCAIGPDGKIHFEEKGYDDSLGEKLGWWVEELSK
jgi:thiol-disulfide isomerase/thioredoxin